MIAYGVPGPQRQCVLWPEGDIEVTQGNIVDDFASIFAVRPIYQDVVGLHICQGSGSVGQLEWPKLGAYQCEANLCDGIPVSPLLCAARSCGFHSLENPNLLV